MSRLSTLFLVIAASSIVLESSQSPGGRAARGIWDGVFTRAQAERGRLSYREHCATCHGADLQGAEYKALQGNRFWTDYQEAPLDYLLGQISRNMPHSEDGSLKGTLGASTYADIVAFMLDANGFPAGATELTEASSAGVAIVRKEGPGELPVGSFAHVVGCLAPRGPDNNWRLVKGSRPVRVLGNRPVDAKAALGNREYTLMYVLTSLDKYAGYRMSVRASLMEGGNGALNVQSIQAVSPTCE
ncbi:MAG TPA: cytochrome c [Vicinamibacterales bacterium]|nr:cytochrome c [Vicinamibacterales bacterium]